ncbi:MAG: phosphorylase family protein [Alphaproteobacteria bacterium]
MGDLTPKAKIVCGIVCGMAAEARALGRWANDPLVGIGISGARPGRAEREARRLVAEGCRVLLSWGVAGGLDPALAPGDLVIPVAVVAEDGGNWPASQTVIARLDRAIQTAEMPRPSRGMTGAGAILGLDRMVLGAAEKAALHERTGAVAVDMESHRVALVAAAAGLPAVAVRAIADPAGRALPALAARALGEDGRPRVGPLVAGLLRRPGDLAALPRVRRDTTAALAALAAVAETVIAAMLPR